MPKACSELAIMPDTRLSDLLETYPQTEDVLLEAIPSFAGLRTPELRAAVGHMLTLEQAAAVAGAPLPDLVLRLRRAAGLADHSASTAAPASAPDWVKNSTILNTLDARPLLAQGQHPKELVLRELSTVGPDQLFLLITPFVPGPLIELGRMQGLETWTRQGEAGKFETYFGRLA